MTSDAAVRPPEVEPFLAGVAFDGVPDVPYPRARPDDALRLPADTWACARLPVGVRIELAGDAEAAVIEYETATDDLGYRGAGAGAVFTAWRKDDKVDEVPAALGRGSATLALGTHGNGDDRVVITIPEGMRPRILSVAGAGGTIRPAARQPRWLCYGDSISEGWVASGPGLAWPAIAGRRYGLDVVNLGFAGSARGEMVMAEAIATVPADVISLSHGTNCWERIIHSAEQVAVGLVAFITLVRTGHPTTPIVVSSPIVRPDAETKANKVGSTLGDIRQAMEETVVRLQATDSRLWLVPGADLVAPDELPDGVHPGDEGHDAMASAIGGAVAEALRSSSRP